MLSDNDIEKIMNRIIDNINPLKIYIFGSYAQNKSTEDSDLDLFIEVDDTKDIFKTKHQLNLLFSDRRIPMDFLVETSTLVKKNMGNGASFYSQIIKDKAKLVYER